MEVRPVVRYMVLCDDIHLTPENDRQVTIVNLVITIRSLESPPHPLLRRKLCVFLALTECRGEGVGKIVCAAGDGHKVFETRERRITFGPDPLEVCRRAVPNSRLPFSRSGAALDSILVLG